MEKVCNLIRENYIIIMGTKIRGANITIGGFHPPWGIFVGYFAGKSLEARRVQ